LPVAGMTRLRLFQYIELGRHVDGPKGQEKEKELVFLNFELSGPKHPPIEIEGRKVPLTMSLTLPLSLNEKARFYKLFKRLNHDGKATHFAQFLGQDFLGTVFHKESGEGTEKRTYANLYNEDGLSIRPPFSVNINPETGDETQIRVTADPLLSPIKCFLWNFATKDMWDSLFIDGTWDDVTDKDGKVIRAGASKNWMQNRIRTARNFADSPLAEILLAGGEPDVGAAETPERSEANQEAAKDADAGAAADPLAGV